MKHPELEQLLTHPQLWRAQQAPSSAAVISGFPDLDAALPGGGWPQGALTEILVAREGLGELSLLMPALAQLSHSGRWLAWVSPPYIPYAPALAAAQVDISRILLVRPRAVQEALWALAQTMAAGTCGAVLAWPSQCTFQDLRRLQLAAEQGNCMAILFRPPETARESSPAALRVLVRREPAGLELHLLKRRGGSQTRVRLNAPKDSVQRAGGESWENMKQASLFPESTY
ncbi:MAG: translesion DNA synthesis-associated protein ImuA [Pseudomonadota bacterium]|nr:translesion DNA synthesis-associated protein ImuA [Pseudomonadota bacterium]